MTDLLQAHYVAGRLSATEFEERIGLAVDARTLADLDVLLADLPQVASAARDRRATANPSGASIVSIAMRSRSAPTPPAT